jgi:pilus assembly protein CpaC
MKKIASALRRTTLALALGLAGPLTTPPAAAQPREYAPDASVRDVSADPSGYGGQLALPTGGSQILRFSQPIGRVMLGDPKVGEVIPLSDRTLYVLGKAAGSTSLTVFPRSGALRPMAALDVRVGYDVAGLRRAMSELIPGEPVEVSARGDAVVLSGLLSSSAVSARAAALAERYAPERVVNLTSIRGAEQVMLSVRVAEVQRSALKQLGISDITGLWDTTQSLELVPGDANPELLASIFGRTVIGENFSIDAIFEALERKGFASTLAEPTLVALSGETAVFFAGGEFPIPVPQESGALTRVTIEFKQYGVSVGFTPTVYGDTINLLVAPEVSALDRDNSVQLQGFRVPGLTTRRAKTTVELRSGQSFAIAGLIRREFSDTLRGLPGVSNLPILGALFRSTAFQNNETEVVIIVTPHLAKPTTRQNLVVPTDLRRGPTETELFLTNATDRPLAAPARAPVAPPAARPASK